MKKYLDFTLTGKKFLSVWLIFYILIIIPYVLYYRSLTNQAETGSLNPLIGLFFFAIIIAAFLISFYIIKLTIENVKYGDNQVSFNGNFFTYLGKILLGFLLSIVTLTIYMAWFIRDITKYIIDNSSIDSTNFQWSTITYNNYIGNIFSLGLF